MAVVLFSTSVLYVLFQHHTETVKIVSCDSAIEKMSVDVAGLDDIFTDFLLCSFSHL
jgi:hypothetical protein